MFAKTTAIMLPWILILISGFAGAKEGETLLFEDDFERNESQELEDELGKGWGTNSDKRAGGNKQVDLGDGTMRVVRHEAADHAVSVVHPAKYKDCRVELRFRLDDKRDDLGIDFADMKCAEVHAGHICKVFFRPTEVEIVDFKSGRMKKAFRDALKAGKATPQQKASVKQYQRNIAHEIELGKWHDAVVTISNDTMTVDIDGKKVGSFSSPGFDHPRKDMIRFSARREVWMDDVKMYALGAGDASTQPTDETPVKHLFGAKLLLRRMQAVDLTDQQLKAFNKLSAELRARVDAMRTEAGITAELIKQRDEIYSELKKTKLKGDALWETLQRKAELTDAQRDAFRETFESNKKFRADALGLLTEEQRSRLPSAKRP